VKRYLSGDEEALREAVRIACLERFERQLGRPWDAQLERFVRGGPARLRDQQEALDVHENLRAAIEKAVEFVQRPRDFATPLGLGSWVPRFIAPLLERDFLRKRAAPTSAERGTARSDRHHLVTTLDAAEILGAERRLDATELAIVWLLGGGWPEDLVPAKNGVTPSQVIQAEVRAFRAAIRETRKKVARPTYRARFEQDDNGRWSATLHLDAEHTVVSEGKTLEEAHRSLREAVALLANQTGGSSGSSRATSARPRARKRRKTP
jgi:predicted RNase H-like HicB family nuclease